MRAVQVIRRQAEHAADGFAAEHVAAAGRELPDPVLRGVDDVAQALLALANAQLGEPAPPALGHFAQRATNRRREPRRVGFEHVIDGTAAQRLDGALFADGPGQKDERHVRRGLERDVERGQAVERRDREIRQNQVRTEIRQRLAECRLRIDSMVDTSNAAAFELSDRKLGIRRYVLDNQHSQVQWHPILLESGRPALTSALALLWPPWRLPGHHAPTGRAS